MAENKYLVLLQQMMLLMKNHNAMRKELMTIAEVADYLGLTESYLYKLTSQRAIPHYKPLKKKIYFKRKEIDAWVFAQPIQTRDKLLERALMPIKVKCPKPKDG